MLMLRETYVLFLYPENKCFYAMSQGLKNEIFFQIMILEHLHFFWLIMPVCHIYFVVNAIFWKTIIEIV